jgi:hypothetical protein
MPFYKEINTLFIHIPKTGGSSLENYLKSKYTEKLYSETGGNKIIPDINLQKISLQHQTFNSIYENRELLDIDFNDNLKIITIVRNPFNKVISDLLWWKFIDINSDKNYVYEIIKLYIKMDNVDNHNLEQYKFIIDNNGNIIDNIKIFKTENLTKELNEYGYEDYYEYPKVDNYYNYLNEKSINLIKEFYKKDFELFNYDTVI